MLSVVVSLFHAKDYTWTKPIIKIYKQNEIMCKHCAVTTGGKFLCNDIAEVCLLSERLEGIRQYERG